MEGVKQIQVEGWDCPAEERGEGMSRGRGAFLPRTEGERQRRGGSTSTAGLRREDCLSSPLRGGERGGEEAKQSKEWRIHAPDVWLAHGSFPHRGEIRQLLSRVV